MTVVERDAARSIGGAAQLEDMRNCDREHLGAMLHYAEKATKLLGSATAGECATDECTFLAISQCMKLVGGAASRIPWGIRCELRGIDWPKLVLLRERMTAYRTVTPEFVVRTVHEDLPPVIASLQRTTEGRVT